MAATFGVVATLRYEFAVMLPNRRYEAIQVLAVSLLNAVLVSVAIVFGLALFRETMLRWMEAESLSKWVFLLPVYVLFAGVVQSLNYWYNRHKLYKYLSVVRVSQAVVLAGVWVAFGLLKWGPLGLILGSVLAQVTGALTFAFSYLQKFPRDWKWVNKADVKRAYVRYRKFFIISSPHAVMNTMQDLIVLIIITQHFSAAIAGLYALSYRILKLPVGLVGASTYQVFLQKANEVKNMPGRLHALVTNIMKRMALIGLVPFVILAIAGPWLFKVAFGNEWEDSGVIARYITPWLYFNFIASTLSGIALVREKQKTAFGMAALDFAVQTGTVYIAAKLGAGLNVFLWMGITGMLYQMFVLRWFYKLSFVTPHEKTA